MCVCEREREREGGRKKCRFDDRKPERNQEMGAKDARALQTCQRIAAHVMKEILPQWRGVRLRGLEGASTLTTQRWRRCHRKNRKPK